MSIPAATTSDYGIVTTGAQSFGGTKTFATVHVGTKDNETNDTKIFVHGAIGLGSDEQAKVYFNHATEIIDFSFN